MKLKSWQVLNEGYKAVVKRAGGERSPTVGSNSDRFTASGDRVVQYSPPRPSAPARPMPTSSNANVASYMRYWRPTGRSGRNNITLTARRLRTIGRWPAGDIQKFLQVAPLTADGKRRVREVLAGVARS